MRRNTMNRSYSETTFVPRCTLILTQAPTMHEALAILTQYHICSYMTQTDHMHITGRQRSTLRARKNQSANLGLAFSPISAHNATRAFSLKLPGLFAKPVVEKTLENS